MAVRQSDKIEYTNEILPGYFYSFGYKIASKKNVQERYKNVNQKGYDKVPVIYCIDVIQGTNIIIGINFHHFTTEMSTQILVGMQKAQNILDEDIQHIFNGKQLYKIFTNIKLGLREYNTTRISKCYRIKNKYIPEILNIPPKFFMKTKEQVNAEQELEVGTNKGF